MIEQILEYNTVVTKAEFLFIIQSVNLSSSAHTCSHVQLCTAICSYLQPSPSVHKTQCNHLQPILSSAHCSYTIQCTLQLYHPVHTAAILSSAHCSYTIQCTLELHYLVPIPYSASSAPLDHHRVSLYHYWPTSIAVSRH